MGVCGSKSKTADPSSSKHSSSKEVQKRDGSVRRTPSNKIERPAEGPKYVEVGTDQLDPCARVS